MFSEHEYLIWLSQLNVGIPSKKYKLYKFFGSAEEIFKADSAELAGSRLLTDKNLAEIKKSQNADRLKKILCKLDVSNISFIGICDSNYPEQLKNISIPPIGLYVLGKLPSAAFKRVAIVGTRRCSEYGMYYAEKFGKELAAHGIAVVSGMAEGIDSKAHSGCISGGGKTIAVLGCGVDIVYPASNYMLRNEIVKNGCVISEYPPLTKPYAYNFPMRNRIISGLSDAVAVIEARKKSGTMITVNEALAQGVSVLALPGDIGRPTSEGCNALLKSGAAPLTEVKDVLELLKIADCNEQRSDLKENKKIINALDKDEKILYSCIDLVPVELDKLMEKTGLDLQTIYAGLLSLELKGLIQQISGRKYIRAAL